MVALGGKKLTAEFIWYITGVATTRLESRVDLAHSTDFVHGILPRNIIKVVYVHPRLPLNGVLKYFLEKE